MRSDLKDLQTLLYRAIIAAPGAARSSRAAVLSGVIRGDERLSALQRLNIYADAYFYRLLDCLKEDFPATAAVIGDAFLGRCSRLPGQASTYGAVDILCGPPVRGFSLQPPSARAVALHGAPGPPRERTLIEVFHAADAPTLSASEVAMIAPADWPTLRLRAHPEFRMLNCDWRANDVLRAVESRTEWREPAHAPVTLLVWGQGAQVYYRELEASQGAGLEAMSKGADFATVCEAFASRFDGEDPAAAIKEMLTRWVADGPLARA